MCRLTLFSSGISPKLRKDAGTPMITFVALLLAMLSAQWSWSQTTFTISGKIQGLGNVPLDECYVAVEGTNSSGPFQAEFIANGNGEYSITLPAGGNYTLKPAKDVDLLNGVTTFDLVLIAKHYLNIESFNSPYQYIAADANNDGVVSVADSTDLRNLILGIYTELPNNSSWRFVRSDYVFPNPADPFHPPYPETFTVSNLSANISNIDFYGVKVGDVNYSAIGQGTPYTRFIKGAVRWDQNSNCLHDTGDANVEGWKIAAYANNDEYLTNTIENGVYTLSLPPGTYDVVVKAPNGLWGACVDTIFGVNVTSSGVDSVDFLVQSNAQCPSMDVQLSTQRLRRCFSNNYYKVQYCNFGTVEAEDAYVVVEFDQYLDVINTSIPFSSVNGNTYTFPVGDVAPGECGEFSVKIAVDCNAVLGQAHCSTAHIYPDSICDPQLQAPWDGSNLVVSGSCNGGEVIFTITNTGQSMTQIAEYVIYEDIMLMMTGGPIQLGAGESQTISIPANGSTWRIEMDQSTQHPFSQQVSAAMEGCGTNGTGNFSLGFVNQFPLNDEAPYEDEDCTANIGSFDPNDKQGIPLGIKAEHFIPKDQDIEYLIRFQNTGTDTAFTVRIVDTLSSKLDLNSLRIAGASHAYRYFLNSENILQFLFENIMLPDSNTNESASHGYVKYIISPKKGLPNGTRIENEAGIYFDFNAPVITNKTLHTLGENYVNVSNVAFQPGIALEVYPNPATRESTFFLKSATPLSGQVQLYNMQGQVVLDKGFDANRFVIQVADLPSGTYFFRLGNGNKILGSGKINIVRD